jgi:hypothetical protein
MKRSLKMSIAFADSSHGGCVGASRAGASRGRWSSCRTLLIGILGVAIGFLLAGSASADEFYIKGGMIEGRVLDESVDWVRLETVSGKLVLPEVAIQRRVPGVSAFEVYAEERGKSPLTMERHLELARWCDEQELYRYAREHAETVLAAEPENAEARELAGYVRVGEVWLNGGSRGKPVSRRGQARINNMVETIQRAWTRRTKTIHDSYLVEDSGQRSFREGRRRILEPRSPLAISPACKILGESSSEIRALLAEFLSNLEGSDEALLHLMVMGLWETDAEVKRAVANELRIRAGEDERITRVLRGLLQSETEWQVRHAAYLLGVIRDAQAIPVLIEALSTSGFEGRRFTNEQILTSLLIEFSAPTILPLGEMVVELPVEYRFNKFTSVWMRLADADPVPRGEFRTEVQDALIAITEQNLGFDVAAWTDWYTQSQKKTPAANP